MLIFMFYVFYDITCDTNHNFCFLRLMHIYCRCFNIGATDENHPIRYFILRDNTFLSNWLHKG
jgi:hypothetical protein